MPSTYSSNLKIELMSTGENSGTWGNITNTNLGTAMEQAVVGYGNPDYTSDANLTITLSNSNAAQAARALVLNVTSVFGSLTATRELVVPTTQKQYIVQNNTTGGQSITVKTSAGTGITVPNGRKAHLYVDDTNVIQMFDFVDINGGAIDGTTIGASSASTGAFTTLNASGATTLDGNVTLGNASGDNVTVTGTITSNLLFTDNTYDIGASGATRPRNLFLAGAATIGGNLAVGGTLTLTGGVSLNGNVTVGDASTDTLTINSTITSNLIFTDNTYDIGASGATRPRNLFLAGSATISGSQTLTGSLTVDSTTDSSSTTTGSIQTDGGLGVAKALFVGTTANIAGAVTLGVTTATSLQGIIGNVTPAAGSFSTLGVTGVSTFAAGSAAAPAITTTGDTNTGIFFPAADTVAASVGGTEGMRLDSSGNLLVGTTSAAAGSASTVYKNADSTWIWRVEAGATSLPNGILVKYSGASPNSTGSQFIYCEDGGGTQRMSVRSNGGIANYSANDANLSDRREKTDFAPAKSYLDTICAIPVQTFNYTDQNMEEDPGLTLGVVAQDVQAVAPELVMESNWGTKVDPKMRLSIYQTDLQYALMKCIQEMKTELDSVKAELATLKRA